MVKIRVRPETGKLYFDFQYQGKRCREYTALDDSKENRCRLKTVAKKMNAEITLATFVYRDYFPNSKRAAQFEARSVVEGRLSDVPLFSEFVEVWFTENEIRWRQSTCESTRVALNKHLLPVFGDQYVSQIKRPDVLQFRAGLANVPGQDGNKSLAPKTINNIMGILNMIMSEAAMRYEFTSPMLNIKRLKQQRKEIKPFSIGEVQLIINTVRPDYRNYFIVRFFTGMRSGEIHGLKWSRVDFESELILVRESVDRGRTEYTKTDGSQREIKMSSVVFEAMRSQFEATGKGEYVFCTKAGTPIDNKNMTDRVWYPLLRHLDLEKRRPYQCRHTAATLWLASGENPEWIARQMGHSTTEMLFRVYSRFVPNLTRQDGSAFDHFLNGAINVNQQERRHD